MRFQFNDGGRAAAGFKRKAKGDCGCRAASIAAERPYLEMYAMIQHYAKMERTSKRKRDISNPESGVYRDTMRKIMESLGWRWVPCMGIGAGCRVHLCADEMPSGRVLANVSHHYVAIVDGVINDLYDPSRGESRCVYGYFVPTERPLKPSDPLPFAIDAPRISPRLLTDSGKTRIPYTKAPRQVRYDAYGWRVFSKAEMRRTAESLIPSHLRPYYVGIEIEKAWGEDALTADNSEIYLYFKAPVRGPIDDSRYVHCRLQDLTQELDACYIDDETEDDEHPCWEYDHDYGRRPIIAIKSHALETFAERRAEMATWRRKKGNRRSRA